MPTPNFSTYQELLEAVKKMDGYSTWQTVTHVVSETAKQNYMARHGRCVWKGVEKEEVEVAKQFLGLVQDFMTQPRTLSDVAGFLLQQRPMVAVAWAVAQKLST